MYEAADIVSRERTGFIPAVNRDSSADRVALNQPVNIPVVGAIAAADITPGTNAPNDGDMAPANVALTITKSRYAPIRWNGEETMSTAGTGIWAQLNRDRFAQAMRTLSNEVESDLALLYAKASRSYGTAGTAPFGTAGDLSDMAQALKILEDNGAPGDFHAVFGSAAIANIRGKQSVLFKVNESGTDDMLRRGIIGDIEGASVHNSAQVKTPTKGTGASYTTNTAGYAVGATSITLITGTGTILAGDTVTFAGDTNKYIVKTALTGGVVVLQEPGLLVAIAASATALTVGNTAAQNMVFSRSAITLATRAPAMPEGGDRAFDVVDIADPISGLSFQVAGYQEYRQVRFEVGLAWGVQMIAPRHAVVLLG
jgi:hypothetical protein